MLYSVQPRDRIFVRGYEFLSFAKNMGKNITKVSKNSQQNNLETFTNEHDKEIRKERYVSPEERPEILDEMRLK